MSKISIVSFISIILVTGVIYPFKMLNKSGVYLYFSLDTTAKGFGSSGYPSTLLVPNATFTASFTDLDKGTGDFDSVVQSSKLFASGYATSMHLFFDAKTANDILYRKINSPFQTIWIDPKGSVEIYKHGDDYEVRILPLGGVDSAAGRYKELVDTYHKGDSRYQGKHLGYLLLFAYDTKKKDFLGTTKYWKFDDVQFYDLPKPSINLSTITSTGRFGSITNTSKADYTIPGYAAQQGEIPAGKTVTLWNKQSPAGKDVYFGGAWGENNTITIKSNDETINPSIYIKKKSEPNASFYFYAGNKDVGDLSLERLNSLYINQQPGMRGLEHADLSFEIGPNDFKLTSIGLYINYLELDPKKDAYVKHEDYILIGPNSVSIKKDWQSKDAKTVPFIGPKGERYKGLADTSLYVHR